MKHRPWNLVFHELIGLRIKVLTYPDPSVSGVEGVIKEETAKTLVVETEKGRRVRLFKQNLLAVVQLPSGERVVLKGEDVLGAPAERVKRLERGRGVARLVASAKRRYPRA